PLENNWRAALAEAAFLTGLERNADVVQMASYAPLFAHVDGWQWAPDLIWVDNLHVYGTPSYQVQKLYSVNKGTMVVPIQEAGKPLTGQEGIYASATVDEQSNELIMKMVNHNDTSLMGRFKIKVRGKLTKEVKHIVLTAPSLEAVNTMEHPD